MSRKRLVATAGAYWLAFYVLAALAVSATGDPALAAGYLCVSFPLTWVGTVAICWRTAIGGSTG